jgi:hypothetical protein
MKRVYWLFLCLLLLVGCVGNEGPGGGPPVKNVTNVTNVTITNVTNVTAPCEDITALSERDDCFKALAVEEGNASICDRVYSVDVRDECILFFSNESILLCDKLTAQDKRDDCFGAHARKGNDSSLCDKIASDEKKESCMRAILSPCTFEADEGKKKLCSAIEKGDYSLCGDDDGCLFSYGINKSDEEACSNISLNARKGACLSIALNGDYCSSFLLRGERDFCYEIIGEETNNMLFCGKATEGTSYENNCYTFLAIKNMDSTICSHCSSDMDRDSCYQNYSLTTGNWSVCSGIRGPNTKDVCYRETAYLYFLPSACTGISSVYGRNACYGVVLGSGEKIEQSECEGISVESWRDQCYYVVAVQTNNKGLCDLIVTDSTKEKCVSKFIE